MLQTGTVSGRLGILLGLAVAGGCVHAEPPAPPPPTVRVAPLEPPAPPLVPCDDRWLVGAERLADADPPASIELLRRCLGREAPPSAYRLLASLESDEGQEDAARRTLLRALALHPDDAFAWANLARIEARTDRGPSALGAIERAHRLRPNDESFAHRHRLYLTRFGRPEERLQARMAPLLFEAEGRAELGDIDGALDTLASVASLAEGDRALLAMVHLRRGHLFLGRRELEAASRAREAGSVSLGEGADHPALRSELELLRSELALANGEARAALEAASAADRWRPGHPLAAANRALAQIALGRRRAAIEALDQALEAGIALRMSREDFLSLAGVAGLVESSEPLRQKVQAVWSR